MHGTDQFGDTMSYAVAGNGPAHGTVALNSDGTYTYTANQGYVGADSFQVTVADGHGGTATQTVTVNDAANTQTIAAGNTGQQSTSGRVATIIPPECWER